jgi:uncharacterized protein YyaL (SSP411 family)
MPNRLINSTSPYLIQHAHNPVDWYEWGNEALTKAVEEDKPILVSIGYSSCHWCHVMERESFENGEIAEIMNEHFVCIKVDREERPDIDHIYMEAVQAMGQNGGWPLNVILTPNQKPFYGGTYFPPRNWANLLIQIHKAFAERRNEIEESAEDLRNHLQRSDLQRFGLPEGAEVNKESLDKMFSVISSRFDKTFGGLEKAPKFIMPSVWHFLLRYHFITKNEEALNIVSYTLEQIACGGIYDQIGGGFARYSVDTKWFAPHFEKMLYDNAQLLSLYSEAFAITKNELFKEVVYETIQWLKSEMTSYQGGFYSALDADSEGVEGKFYTWTHEELKQALGDDLEIVEKYYHSTEEGNWEHGRSILKRSSISQYKPEVNHLNEVKKKLLNVRKKRIRPGLDDKVLTGWNAMTIQGLIDAYKTFQDEKFLQMALKNISFLESHLITDKVFRAFKNKHSETEAFLEDYAFLIQAYTSLYQVTFNEGWLYKAKYWTVYVLNNFYDKADDYFHFSSSTAEQLIAKKKEIFDNVIPSSNSMMARNLYTLGTILDISEWKDIAIKMTTKLQSLIEAEPTYMSNWGLALSDIVHGISEVVISGENALTMNLDLQKVYLPFKATAGTTSSSELSLLEGREAKPGSTFIYVCENKTCKLPVTDVEEAIKLLVH